MMYEIFFQRLAASLYARVVHSILAGIAGAMILILFFSGLMAADAVSLLLPWIIGFNGAMAGFMLVDKTRGRLSHRHVFTTGSGLLLVIGVFILTNLFFQYSWGTALIAQTDLLILVPVGVVLSGLGGSLAVKYDNLNRAKSK